MYWKVGKASNIGETEQWKGCYARENRRGNQEWTFERHRQHWAHETQDEDKQNTQTQHNTEKMSNTDSTKISRTTFPTRLLRP
jgi:hypothetical protein